MLKIRKALHTDIDDIIVMCEEHAVFEGAKFNRENDLKANLVSLIFTRRKLICLVAENDLGLIGYTTCTEQYATWTASSYLYMDCLYLKQETRGLGVGSLFMKEIADLAKEMGLSEVQWQTPAANLKAIAFYTKLGAKELSKSRFIWAP